jgi:hypothetical protein
MNRFRRCLAVALVWTLTVPTQSVSAAAFRALSLPAGAQLSGPLAPQALGMPVLPFLPSASVGLATPMGPGDFARLPSVAPAPAAAVPAPAAALPALQKLSAETGAAKPGSVESAASLDRHFDAAGSNGKNGSDAPSVLGTVSGASSSLSPSGASSPSPRATPPPRSPRDGQRGAVNVKLIAIIGGVVLAVAILVGALLHSGHKQDAFWKDSKASTDVVAVETARRAGDAESLFKIAAEARKRQAQETEQVADAKSRHQDKIGAQSVSDVEKLAAFDGMAAARAELGANDVSKDAARRMGGRLTSEWQAKLGTLDAEARAAGFEGKVARELDVLGTEVAGERAADARLQADVSAFSDKLPTLGGGLLKEQAQKARGELSAFESNELNAEAALQAQEAGAVRGRLYARLSSGSSEFKSHADRRDALASLADGSLKSAVELSESLDNDLRDMSTHLASKTTHLKEASRWDDEAQRLQRVEVKDQAKDAQGNVMHDAAGNIVYTVHYEDQSGPARDNARRERDAARSEADQARGLGVSADRSAVALRTLVVTLRRDPLVAREGLQASVPATVPGIRVYIGYDWYDVGSADVDFFLNQLTEQQANEVRARFGGVVEPLRQAQSEVNGRRSSESGWLDKRVDDELAREKARDY